MSTPNKFAALPRSKTLTGKPPTKERIFVDTLERTFPGSTWEPPAGRTLAEEQNECGPQGSSTGPEPDSGGEIGPLRNLGPQPASTQPDASMMTQSDGIPTLGGAEALDFVVIVGSDYDKPQLRKWAESLSPDARVMIGSPRFSKTGVPMNGEALIMDARPSTLECEWGEDYFGKDFRTIQVGTLVTLAAVEKATIVLVGSGTKIRKAIEVIDRFVGLEVLELGH